MTRRRAVAPRGGRYHLIEDSDADLCASTRTSGEARLLGPGHFPANAPRSDLPEGVSTLLIGNYAAESDPGLKSVTLRAYDHAFTG